MLQIDQFLWALLLEWAISIMIRLHFLKYHLLIVWSGFKFVTIGLSFNLKTTFDKYRNCNSKIMKFAQAMWLRNCRGSVWTRVYMALKCVCMAWTTLSKFAWSARRKEVSFRMIWVFISSYADFTERNLTPKTELLFGGWSELLVWVLPTDVQKHSSSKTVRTADIISLVALNVWQHDRL